MISLIRVRGRIKGNCKATNHLHTPPTHTVAGPNPEKASSADHKVLLKLFLWCLVLVAVLLLPLLLRLLAFNTSACSSVHICLTNRQTSTDSNGVWAHSVVSKYQGRNESVGNDFFLFATNHTPPPPPSLAAGDGTTFWNYG